MLTLTVCLLPFVGTLSGLCLAAQAGWPEAACWAAALLGLLVSSVVAGALALTAPQGRP